jgi:hypothetical protein
MSASLALFEKEHAAREKYIYFVCGLAGVLFAYIGKDYFPVRPFDCAAILTIGAMISLTLCLVLGMARIQSYIEGLSINRVGLGNEEELKNIRDSLVMWKAGQANYTVSKKTGKEYRTIEELEEDIKLLQTSVNKDYNRMKKWFNWATYLFIACHFFLVVGFILLICAKLVV